MNKYQDRQQLKVMQSKIKGKQLADEIIQELNDQELLENILMDIQPEQLIEEIEAIEDYWTTENQEEVEALMRLYWIVPMTRDEKDRLLNKYK